MLMVVVVVVVVIAVVSEETATVSPVLPKHTINAQEEKPNAPRKQTT
jgi:hypothetical protein